MGALAALSCLCLVSLANASREVNANAETPQAIPSKTATALRFAEIKADADGELDATGRYKPKRAGYYRLSALVALSNAKGAAVAVYVFKNGQRYRTLAGYGGSVNGNYYGGDTLIYADGSKDSFDVRVWHDAGAPVSAYGSSNYGDISHFSADYLGATPTGAVAATAGTTQPINDRTLTPVAFAEKEADPSSWFDGSTGRYQPRESGYYRISSTVAMAGGSGSVAVYLYKNGKLERTLGGGANSPSGAYVSGSAVVAANGTTDTFEIKVWQNSGATLGAYGSLRNPDGSASADVSQFSASKIPSGNIVFAAYASAQQTISHGILTKLSFGGEKFDPSNVFDSRTGTFVAPRAGFYRLSATLTLDAGGNTGVIYLYKNGRYYSQFGSAPNNSSGAYVSGTLVVYAPTPGTTFDLRGWQNSGGDLTAHGGPAGDVSQFSADELTPDVPYPATPPIQTEVFTLPADVPVTMCNPVDRDPIVVFDKTLRFRGNALAQVNLIVENKGAKSYYYNVGVRVGTPGYDPANGDDLCPGDIREKVNFGYGTLSDAAPTVKVGLRQDAMDGAGCVRGSIVIKAGSTLTVYEEAPAYAGKRIQRDSWSYPPRPAAPTYDWQHTLSEMLKIDVDLRTRTTVLVTSVVEGTVTSSPNKVCGAETVPLYTEAWVGSRSISQNQQPMPASGGMAHLVLYNEDWRQLTSNRYRVGLRVRKDPAITSTVDSGGSRGGDGVIWTVLLDY